MKKLYFVAIVALLALAMVSCDNFGKPEKGGPSITYDENGLALVEFDISISDRNRALTTPLAKAGVDFYEVVFVYDSEPLAAGQGTEVISTYRTFFREGKTARMMVPAATYHNAVNHNLVTTNDRNAAYLFAGRYDSKTLLAIGVLTGTFVYDDGNPPAIGPAQAISNQTVRVVFTLYPLLTDVNAGATSTFTIEDGGLPGPVVPIKVNEVDIPAFILTLDSANTVGGPTPITGSFSIQMPAAAPVPPASAPLVASLQVADAYQFTTSGYLFDDGDYSLSEFDPLGVTSSITFSNVGAAGTAVTFPLLMTIVTPNKKGLCKVYFEIPVHNQNATVGASNAAIPVIWYLRGGINHHLVDAGKNFNDGDGSQGGALVFAIGDVLEGTGFEVGKTW